LSNKPDLEQNLDVEPIKTNTGVRQAPFYSQLAYSQIIFNHVIRIMKSRRMRWAGHIARFGEKRNSCRILVGSQKERDYCED
jgi:hypothetical protein